jgi:hypothetical protein
MNGSPVAGLVRGWVGLYTRGLPAELRAARRDEIADDLWCQHEEAAALGRSGRSLDTDLVMRLLFGMPADITWRLTYRGKTPAPIVERSSSMSTRTLGGLAIFAGLAWGMLFIAFIPLGEGVRTGDIGVAGVLGSLLAAIAFSTAAIGLAWRFQDRVSPLGAVGALLVTLGALTSMVGSITLMLIGSVMLMWDLARIGVVPWLFSILHMAAAIVVGVGLVVGHPNGVDAPTRAVFVALVLPYVVTWIALGVSLVRGTPHVAPASA